MGYNSLGNIVFFGAGMYICAVVQIGLYYDVAAYTSAFGAVKVDFSYREYFTGLALGLVAAGLGPILFAVLFGRCVLGLGGTHFAIGPLGFHLADAQRGAGWASVGGGGGNHMPEYAGNHFD